MSHRLSTEKIGALRRKEVHLLQALSEVRFELNEFALVSMLPTEILEEIFAICASWPYSGCKPEHRLSWTKVCRSWRCIAFNAVRLWTRIDIANWHYAHQCLKHSGSAPVHLISSRAPALHARDLQPLGKRVQSIDFNLFPADLAILFKLLGPDLPYLDSLALAVPVVSTNSTLEIVVPPRLKRLVLDCISIPWNTCFGLNELTHLSLRGLTSGFSPTLTELFTILEGSPRLERIQLTCLSPDTTDFNPYAARTITLPNLRELSVGSKAQVILAFLSCIVLQPKTRLQISCSQFESIRDLFPSNSVTMFKAYYLRSIRIEPEAVHIFGSSITPWMDEQLESIISFRYSLALRNHVLIHISQIFDLSNITVLEVGGLISPRWALLLLLEVVPNLEILRVGSSDLIGDILSTLSEVDLTSVKDRKLNNPVLCPRLQHISFGRPEHESCFEDKYSDRLIKLAQKRRNAGSPLETLEFIQRYKLPSHLLDKLKGLVDRIILRA